MEKIARQPLVSELSRRRKLDTLARLLPAGAKILEVGAGDGWFSAQLRSRGHQTMTIDLVANADIIGDINDWRNLGIPPGTFDAVVALEVIEHVDCWASLKAICKPGGLIMLSSPHPRWDWVMKTLEALHLTQTRTSPHSNLTDFTTLDLPAVIAQRPGIVHQVSVFRNTSP